MPKYGAGNRFFSKTFFRVIFLEEYTLPPRQESFIIIAFSISYNRFTTFHFSLIRAEKREQRYCPCVRHLAPYRHYTRKIRTRITPVSHGRVPWCGPVAVGRDAWPPPPVGVPTLPARAVAPRRGARLDNPRPRRASPSCGSRPTAHYPRVMHTPLHPRITRAAR